MGEGGSLKKLSLRFLGMDFPNRELVCRGQVIGKTEGKGGSLVECEVWLANPSGEVTLRGTALVALPRRPRP